MLAPLLLLSLWAAAAAPDAKEIKAFVETPISELNSRWIERMMAVDENEVPEKLRFKLRARKLELRALKDIRAGEKKGFVRMPEKECDIPTDSKSDDEKALKAAGFEFLEDHEEELLEQKTHCTERQLMCEFSLQIVVARDPKTKKVRTRHYYIHERDPLFVIVAAARKGNNIGGNTDFFGKVPPACAN